MKKKNIYDYSYYNFENHLIENYDWDFARIKIRSGLHEKNCFVKIYLNGDLLYQYEFVGDNKDAYTDAYYKLLNVLNKKVARINEFLEDVK